MTTIICSHGFGVRADSRGLFTDIAAAFGDCEFKMFDYDDYRPNGDATVRSLPERVKLLQAQIDAVEGEIFLLCHSLGCVVGSMADLSKVDKVVLLAPPEHISSKRFIDWLQSEREGTKLDQGGALVLPRSDGSTTRIPKEFLDSADAANPMDLYQKLADSKPTVVIRALSDELVGLTKVDEMKNAQLIDIDSDHNFTGENRQKLIDALRVIF